MTNGQDLSYSYPLIVEDMLNSYLFSIQFHEENLKSFQVQVPWKNVPCLISPNKIQNLKNVPKSMFSDEVLWND